MTKSIKLLAAAALLLCTNMVCAQAPAAGPAPGDTEVNLLKLEMQRLRSDVETMKGHIGRLVQYLQQRDSQSRAVRRRPARRRRNCRRRRARQRLDKWANPPLASPCQD